MQKIVLEESGVSGHMSCVGHDVDVVKHLFEISIFQIQTLNQLCFMFSIMQIQRIYNEPTISLGKTCNFSQSFM